MMEKITKILEKNQTPATIRKALKAAKIAFKDTTDLHEYFNLEIPVEGGFIRIYKPYKGKHYVAQKMTRFTAKYSGIPVFFG